MVDDPKREQIHAAAVVEFSRRGFTGTSMANIAEAAGMSRPALYQYFRNKGDIFASTFKALIEKHVELALAALAEGATVADQLDGFLQRFEGDLWEHMAASPHFEEIMSAKSDEVMASIAPASARLWSGLTTHLDTVATSSEEATRADWIDLLHFSPKGFKLDQPSIDTYRRRLATLARTIAAEIAQAGAAT